MARRRRRDDLTVSLFPFLSVLACVIGTLTLLLAAIAIGRLGGPSLDWIRMAEQLAALREVAAAGEAKLEMLEAQLRRREVRAEEAEAMGRRLAALGLSPEISLEELQALSELTSEAAELEREKRRLEQTRAKLVERASVDEKTLKSRREARDAAPIIIEPSGIGRQYTPFLIECTADYVEAYGSGGSRSYRMPIQEMGLESRLPRLLRRIGNIPGSIVIFLIRPDGVETCQEARRMADGHSVRVAELPLPGTGPLDLSRMSGGR